MLRKPDDRTPADSLSDAVRAALDDADDATATPVAFGRRMWEHYASTLQIRGGKYPDPEDSVEEIEGNTSSMPGPAPTPQFKISDDWEDTRVHIDVFDLAEERDEPAVLIALHHRDADRDAAWIATPEATRDALAVGINAGDDDDWEVFEVRRSGTELLHDVLERSDHRVVDYRDASDPSPYAAHRT